MTKLIDEIQEEIKREDFFNKLRKYLPLLVAAAISVVSAAGIYTWWRHSYENQLFLDESLYNHGVESLANADFPKARKIFDKLIANSKALRFVSFLQKNRCEQASYLLTNSQKAFLEVKQNYQNLTKEYHSVPLENFLTTSLAFLTIGGNLDDSLKEKLSAFMTPKSSWYNLMLAYKALNAYASNNSSEIAPDFALWNKYASSQFGQVSWLIKYCSLGSMAKAPRQ